MHNPLDYTNNLGTELRRIGVDLDGTLAETVWPELGIGKPITKTVEWVRQQAAEGYKIIIFTSRANNEWPDIAKWCRAYGVPFEWIETGKIMCKYYVDDRNKFLEWINDSR